MTQQRLQTRSGSPQTLLNKSHQLNNSNSSSSQHSSRPASTAASSHQTSRQQSPILLASQQSTQQQQQHSNQSQLRAHSPHSQQCKVQATINQHQTLQPHAIVPAASLDTENDDMILLNPSSSNAPQRQQIYTDRLTEERLALYRQQLMQQHITGVKETFMATVELLRFCLSKRSVKQMSCGDEMLQYLQYLQHECCAVRPYDIAISNACRQVLCLVRAELQDAKSKSTIAGASASSSVGVQLQAPSGSPRHRHRISQQSTASESSPAEMNERSLFHKLKPLIMEATHELLTQVDTAADDIAQQVSEHILPQSTLLVHSYSRDVLQCLVESHSRIKSLYVAVGALRNGAEHRNRATQSIYYKPATGVAASNSGGAANAKSGGGAKGGAQQKGKKQKATNQQSATSGNAASSSAASALTARRVPNGATLARELARICPKLSITVISDSAVFAIMPLIDIVLIDSVSVLSPDGAVLAQHGTLNLALAAQHHRRRVIALAPFYKLTPLTSDSSPALTKLQQFGQPQRVLQPELACAKVTGCSPLFDLIPPRMMHILVGDAAQRPNQMQRQINEYYNAKDCL